MRLELPSPLSFAPGWSFAFARGERTTPWGTALRNAAFGTVPLERAISVNSRMKMCFPRGF